jgi:hypothetical protein
MKNTWPGVQSRLRTGDVNEFKPRAGVYPEHGAMVISMSELSPGIIQRGIRII